VARPGLSNSLTRSAGLTGLEPATSAVTVRHSNQTELQPPYDTDRAGDRTRTGDLLHGKQTLYQLSYARALTNPRSVTYAPTGNRTARSIPSLHMP
jgi:hypothetical protein